MLLEMFIDPYVTPVTPGIDFIYLLIDTVID